MRRPKSSAQHGQVLVIVATALMLVMLASAAIVVDLGNGFLNKQRLQNTADAAALAAAYRIASGGDHTAAVAAARSIVTQNTGGAVSLPDPPTGSGQGVSNGIEISGTDVRVALTRSDVRTFFAGVLGRNTLTVAARARATVNAGGGLMPIAVKRYSAGNTLYPLNPPSNPNTVVDYLAQAIHSIGDWPSPWPNLLTGGASPAATTASPGPVIPILGHDAVANEAQGNDFHFWVAPDVRNITWSYPPGPTYTNGVTASSSVQDLKNLESTYFSPTRPGYGSVEGLPDVGDQIAILNGVDTNNTVGEMEKYYAPGKYVVAMVYDGTVHRRPEFQLTVNPVYRQEGHDPLQDVTYNVTLDQTNNTNPYYGFGINMSVVGLDSSFASWNFSENNITMSGSDRNTTLIVEPAHPDDPTPPDTTPEKTNGARSFLIRAWDPTNHIYRTATAAVLFGNDPAFMATCSSAYQQVEQGSSGQFTVDLEGYNGYPNTNVTVGAPGWEGTSPSGVTAGYVNHNPGNVQSTTQLVRDGHTSTFNVYFDVGSVASVGQYVMKIPISDGTNTQYMYLALDIVAPSTGSTVGNAVSFVYVLGYAAFQIDHYTNNTVYGKAVSDLVADPSTLTVGSAVRLVGWNQ